MEKVPDRRRVGRDTTMGEILGAAVELMARDGVAGMSLSAVARRVGMKPPSLYEYFPSKRDLYDALFERSAAGLRDAVASAGSQHPDQPVAALRAGARAFVQWSVGNPVAAQLVNWRPVPGFEPSPQAYVPSQETVALLRAQIKLAVSRNELRASAATEEAVLLFTTVVAGVVSQQLANEPAGGGSGRYARLVEPAVSLWLEHYSP
ncbi:MULTISPECIES: TetR/AcrR family transcriptional regulator [unclassified Arthrobacter]|uniref:TetR/AcrR family transcriptional regulator n=1 Tax=unclassified Arthrobacter TaxID=235627 RepID=UPI00159E970E|nr:MULTISPECIES: TetR/AcrR family transcriptional regulator [unclassified Arthrobacter]MCQ9165778.1 TetR/AcrR family transcriptional regulator [Arthrobacter sp. STN4]NVM99076.1 TetR/AcrR family transcriptional regulator [Arthrobacter sp. SDTb3-6]